jgi:hypothetical protein
MGKQTVEKDTIHVANVFDGNQVRVDKVTLNGLSANPSDAIEAELWYRSDTHAFMGKKNTGVVTFAKKLETVKTVNASSLIS